MNVDLSQLQKPLPYLLRPGEIRRTKKGFEAQCLAYLDRTVIETALDVAVGAGGWQMELATFSPDGAVRCSLGLFTGGAWRWRHGIGYPEDARLPATAAATNAFKNAAGRWGVGRFLRDLPQPWLPCRCTLLKSEKEKGPRVPVFAAWDCDPYDRMEACIAAAQRPGTDRVFLAMQEHGVTMPQVARWVYDQGARDLNGLSPAQRGQLESLIVSGHFKGGSNGAAAEA